MIRCLFYPYEKRCLQECIRKILKIHSNISTNRRFALDRLMLYGFFKFLFTLEKMLFTLVVWAN